ncbi:hypothetical protein [Celeribacter sp.]|uniref:hypothetical protein n=1 Tax=Celeribacter sp. TaxID=1890673 RepID=UPI003A916BEF
MGIYLALLLLAALGYLALYFWAIRPVARAWRNNKAAPVLALLYIQACILIIASDGSASSIFTIGGLGYAPLVLMGFLIDPFRYKIFLHDFHGTVLWLTSITWFLPTIGLLFFRRHVSAVLLLPALPALTFVVVSHSVEAHFAELIPEKARELGATCLWQQSVRESRLDAADGFESSYHAVAHLPNGDWMAWSYKANDFYLIDQEQYPHVNPIIYRDSCKPLG